MHIHGTSLNPAALNLYSAVEAQKTAAAQRAAEVRKKLIAGAAQLEGDFNPEDLVILPQDPREDFPQQQSPDDDPPDECNPDAPTDPDDVSDTAPDTEDDISSPDPISDWA